MKKNSTKKFIIAVIIIVIITIISFGLYSYFNRGNNNGTHENNDNKPQAQTTKITSGYLFVLREEEQEVLLKGKAVALKLIKNELYVNGKKVSNVKIDGAVVTDQVILFTRKGACHDFISYVIDSDGNSVPFTKNNYQMYDFRMLNGNFVAAGSEECPCNPETCDEKVDITFAYNGRELTIE